MDASVLIAVLAVAVSVGSFVVSIWATRISKRTLEYAAGVQRDAERREFERVRTDLLNQIADIRALLDLTRLEIRTLQANFSAEPPAVQALMGNFTGLFTEYLPKLETALRGAEECWLKVARWEETKTHKELMEAKAILYRSLQDDRSAHDSGMYLVTRFSIHLDEARQRVLSTQRAVRPEIAT
jgi:hypothetical protein